MLETIQIPVWEVMLHDLSGNAVMDISAMVDFEWVPVLNENHTFSFSMNLALFERECAAIGLHPRNVLYPALTQVMVKRNGIYKFGGFVSNSPSNLDQNNSTIEVTCDSWVQYFAGRLLKKDYLSTDRSEIAWDAIETAQAVPYGDLGVTLGVTEPTYHSDLTADYTDIKTIIQTYTYARPVTYDYEITPEKVFNTYLHLGSYRPEYPLVYPQNVVSMGIPRSSDTLFNKVIGIGSGIGDERIETIQGESDSQQKYLVREKKQVYNSVSRQDTLEENTEGFLNESTEVLVIPDIEIMPGAIDIDIVSVGDTVPVMVIGSAYNDDLSGDFRIYGMNVRVRKGIELPIRINVYKPDSGGGTE